MLESPVEKHFRTTSLRNRVWAIKIHPFGLRGFPDRLCLVEGGWVFFVELKRPKKGVIAKRQSYMATQLRSLKFDVYVLSSKEQVDTFYAEKPYLQEIRS